MRQSHLTRQARTGRIGLKRQIQHVFFRRTRCIQLYYWRGFVVVVVWHVHVTRGAHGLAATRAFQIFRQELRSFDGAFRHTQQWFRGVIVPFQIELRVIVVVVVVVGCFLCDEFLLNGLGQCLQSGGAKRLQVTDGHVFAVDWFQRLQKSLVNGRLLLGGYL